MTNAHEHDESENDIEHYVVIQGRNDAVLDRRTGAVTLITDTVLSHIPADVLAVTVPNGFHTYQIAGPSVPQPYPTPFVSGLLQEYKPQSWWDALVRARADYPHLDMIAITEDGSVILCNHAAFLEYGPPVKSYWSWESAN